MANQKTLIRLTAEQIITHAKFAKMDAVAGELLNAEDQFKSIGALATKLVAQLEKERHDNVTPIEKAAKEAAKK